MAERRGVGQWLAEASRTKTFQVVVGTLSGVAIIVLAVAISALVFHAYGWGLFVLTPFVVGITTGFLVNRHELQSMKATNGLVLLSAALGCFGLILFALEGLICLILASPLGALAAIAGGAVGRRAARIGKDPMGPIYCVALLPAMFMVDAAFPPTTTFPTSESIIVEAAAPKVWDAVISDELIQVPPTLAGRLGLAYPQRAHLSGRRVGAVRTGYFSTGETREQVTNWDEGRSLGFMVLTQPPAMKEMSPYQRVHAPHVNGYFETGETQFLLEPLGPQRTRLTIRAAHRLKIDPIIYWEPIARWAASSNTRRVLQDLKLKAETDAS
ncbi:SRPBCC family protein [Sphingomonas sp.]|uniref:SRPBCC family protein n=1 Tax=Sphingomonas sp. TaxID=28214 RepID=UPI0025D9E194|nr:SRPBCC family protein [Sphingomonas sp.]